MSDFKSEILEVKRLIEEVNELIAKQKTVLNDAASAVSNYGKAAKVPSAFIEAQKESIALSKAQQAEQTRLNKATLEAEQIRIKGIQAQKASIQLANAETKAQQATLNANRDLSRAYVQLNARRTEAKNKLQDLIASEKASNKELRQAQKEFDILNKKVAAADKAVGRFSEANRKINGLATSVGNLMTAFGVGTGLYLFTDLVKNIYQTTKQLQSLDLALKMVSGTQQEFAINQSFLSNLAEQYGIEIKGLTKNFTEFWVASKGKLESEQIKAVFTSISKSVAVMGLSVEQQDSAFLALQQMMSKGTVQAEELKKQLGNALPGAVKAATMAYQALHPEMKVTEKFFMEQMKAGKVLSSELLPELAKAYEKLYGIENVKRAETLQAAQERLQNSWTDLVRSMNEANNSGLARFLSSTMEMLQNFVDFTKLLFKDENQLQKYFQRLGEGQGTQYYDKVMKNLSGVSDAQRKKTIQEIVKRERENIVKDLKIVAEEKAKRASLTGGDRALFHLQTKLEEDALVRIGKSQAILKAISGSRVKATSTQIIDPIKETEKERKAREKADRDRLKALKESMKVESVGGVTLSAQQDTALEKLKLLKEALEKTRDETSKNSYEFLQFEKTLKGVNEAIDIFTKPLEGKNIIDELEKKVKTYNDTQEELAKKAKDANKALYETFRMFGGDFADRLGFTDTFDFLLNPDKNGNTLFDRLKTEEDHWRDYALAVTTITQDMYNFINQQSQSRFEAEYDRLAKQKEYALQFAGDSDAAKKKIEEDYEKRRKEIAVREAKAKKQQAMFNIAIDTAQAIMAVSAQGKLWLTLVVAALGASQLAMVSAQKIPEYWKGTDNAQEGLAWTQEKGQEIITDKKGNIKDMGDNKGARLTKLSAGDKVYTAEQTKRLLFEKEYNNILSGNGIIAPKIEVHQGATKEDMDIILGKYFSNIQTNHTTFDKRGINQWSSANGNRTIRNSNRGSSKGFNV